MAKYQEWIGFDGWRWKPETNLQITMCTLYRSGYTLAEIRGILGVSVKTSKQVYDFCTAQRGKGYDVKWVQDQIRRNS